MRKSISPLGEITVQPPSRPWTRLGKHLESACRKALFDFSLLEECTHLGIALSGGKDSLTLLYLLHAILGRGFPKLKFSALHVSGVFSCGPSILEDSLHKACDALGVPLHVYTSPFKRVEDLACYSCSRERRKLLFGGAKEHGIDTIAFGHHRDDSIQTLLLNLLHKGEFAANLPLVPMQTYGVRIIRPLIYIKEEDIRSFAKMYGFERITCQCPVGQNSKRKKIEEMINILEEVFPHTRSNLSLASLHYGSKKALTP